MGAPFEIMAEGNEARCAEAIDEAFAEAARIEGLFTIYRPDAPLARFNRDSKIGTTPFEAEILALLSKALVFAQRSEGAFDPTAGPLIDLWGFGPGGQKKRFPKKETILKTRDTVGFEALKIDRSQGVLIASKSGLQLNLGGIAKGYAVDCAVQVLKRHGIVRGLINCGSTLYGFGNPGWKIMIQDPRKESQTMGAIVLSDQAMATSGDYERCFFHEGRRYSHLLDPRTGYPVLGMASVTVLSETAVAADALSTAAFVLGREKGTMFLDAQPGTAGFLVSENIDQELNTQYTSRWPTMFSDIHLTRRRFMKAASIAALGFILPGGMLWPFQSEASSIRYATEKEALRRMMPEADGFRVEGITLTKDQLKAAQKLTGKGFRKKKYDFWVGQKGKDNIGYGLKLNVIGKKRPITFFIGITPEGQVLGVEVLIYRESKGSEVRYARFMDQFHKKTSVDPLRLGRDIRPISGATLSSRAAAYAVRKALAIFKVVY